VRRLPPDQRRVIVGRFVREKSIRDLARELQKTDGAVKQLQLRAIDSLRKRLSEPNA
jgi:RNA polymerase sigma-70 factor (ECF subfamily)